MAMLAPSSASARALAAPMQREPPVTRATLPVSDLVIGFLRCLNSDDIWICASSWSINRNYRNASFPLLRLQEDPNDKTSRFRRPRDFRKSRGITVICGGRGRTGAVQGHGVEGGQPTGGAAWREAIQPDLAAPRLDRCRAKAVRARRAAAGRWRGGGERGAGAVGGAARAGAARGADDVRGESGGADPAGVSASLSRCRDRSSLERRHGGSDRGGIRRGLADREPAGLVIDRAAAVRDAALHRGVARLSRAPWPADPSDASRAA